MMGATCDLRIGQGYDVHRLVENRPLILGGVRIDHPKGLDGHSDADVLTHVIGDAMLGAAALGDLGKHFPDTDEQFKGINSIELLKKIVALLASKNWRIVNVDTTVIAEKPKLSSYISSIQMRLAGAMGIDPSCVGVKATTTEGLGYTGRSEGMGAMAAVLIQKTG